MRAKKQVRKNIQLSKIKSNQREKVPRLGGGFAGMAQIEARRGLGARFRVWMID
jgi:hypothetical protein